MLMIRINKTQEILIVFDDIIADMLSNNSAELFFVVKSQVFLFLFFLSHNHIVELKQYIY